MNDLKLIILCGGNSTEREVSISTGKAIYECLSHLCNVKLIYYEKVIESIIPKFKSADLVFNALHGGAGENGDIQSIFEKYDIKYLTRLELYCDHLKKKCPLIKNNNKLYSDNDHHTDNGAKYFSNQGEKIMDKLIN